MIENISFLW